MPETEDGARDDETGHRPAQREEADDAKDDEPGTEQHGRLLAPAVHDAADLQREQQRDESEGGAERPDPGRGQAEVEGAVADGRSGDEEGGVQADRVSEQHADPGAARQGWTHRGRVCRGGSGRFPLPLGSRTC